MDAARAHHAAPVQAGARPPRRKNQEKFSANMNQWYHRKTRKVNFIFLVKN
ncbi:MAG: hypothetical protein ACR2P5_00615 [Gammaproteobacteria bacterium]